MSSVSTRSRAGNGDTNGSSSSSSSSSSFNSSRQPQQSSRQQPVQQQATARATPSRKGKATADSQSTMLQTQESLAKGAIDDLRARADVLNDDEDVKSKMTRKRNIERANVDTQLRQSQILAAEARAAVEKFKYVDSMDSKLWAEDMHARTLGMRSLSGQAIHHAEIANVENQIIRDKERHIQLNRQAMSNDKDRLETSLADMEKLSLDFTGQRDNEDEEDEDGHEEGMDQ